MTEVDVPRRAGSTFSEKPLQGCITVQYVMQNPLVLGARSATVLSYWARHKSLLQ
jgi:hypothetical protein